MIVYAFQWNWWMQTKAGQANSLELELKVLQADFRGSMEMVTRDHFFQYSVKLGLNVGLNIFFPGQWGCWIWWYEFLLKTNLLSEVIINV